MKVLTVTGTRPELIRLSVILKKLDGVCDHVHVHTSQNADPNLNDIFLRDLKIRQPNYVVEEVPRQEFLGNMFTRIGHILSLENPDKVLILGDTNSGLAAVIASKMGFPVYHMEAGNRCFDEVVPEEINRRVIDACSYMNLPYTENSKENLVNELFHKNRVFKTGNPIWEVLNYYKQEIATSDVLQRLGLAPYGGGAMAKYALLSLHRTENVDHPPTVKSILKAMLVVAGAEQVIFPIHPRTRDQFEKQGVEIPPNVKCIDPVGFFDFVKLEQYAHVVFTDSGTVPEETLFWEVPCVVLRNTTERQELMEGGSLILAGTRTEDILRAFWKIEQMKSKWDIPPDYAKTNVSDTVVRILLGQNIKIQRKGHDEF